METMELDLIAISATTGETDWHCGGPNQAGACDRIAVGEAVPCTEHVLIRAGAPVGEGYAVPDGMTLCPVTLALSLAVPSDAAFLPD